MRRGAVLMACLLMMIFVASLALAQKKTAEEYFQEGSKYFVQGNIDRAIESYKEGLKLEPESAVGYNLLGMAYRAKYNRLGSMIWKEREIQAFKKAIELNPLYMPALVNLGTTLYYMGRKREAAEYFQKALKVYPDHPQRKLIEKMIKEGLHEKGKAH